MQYYFCGLPAHWGCVCVYIHKGHSEALPWKHPVHPFPSLMAHVLIFILAAGKTYTSQPWPGSLIHVHDCSSLQFIDIWWLLAELLAPLIKHCHWNAVKENERFVCSIIWVMDHPCNESTKVIINNESSWDTHIHQRIATWLVHLILCLVS